MLSIPRQFDLKSKDDDLHFMERAIRLAQAPKVSVLPNPRVGAVIVLDGRIVGEGFHSGPGQPHAEVIAIRDAERNGITDFSDATLYVSLEPCSHLKKRTPPCAPLLIEKRFSRIVVASVDPNPEVAGRGITQIRNEGILVDVGCGEDAAISINQAFIKNQRLRRPYTTLKIAMTFDGKLADDWGKSQWISNEKCRQLVHEWRAMSDAVAIGAGTIDRDDPQLNSRTKRHKIAKKIVVFGTPRRPLQKWAATKANGVENIYQCSRRSTLKTHLKNLYERHSICSLFVEGGPRLASEFLKSNLVDEIILIYGRGFLGGKATHSLLTESKRRLSQIIDFEANESRIVDGNLIVRGVKNVYRPH